VHPSRVDGKAPAVRVAVCAAGEIWGGVERFIVTLATGLRYLGIELLVVLFYDGPLAAALREQRISVVTLESFGKYDPRTVTQLRGVLREHRINVLHVHGYRASVVGCLAARPLGIKIVKTEHGQIEPFPGWRAVLSHARLIANAALERLANRCSLDAQVFVSADIQQRLRLTAARIPQRVIHNGIETPRPRTDTLRERRSSADAAFDVGIVGRIDKVKGHEILLRAVACLRHLPRLRVHVFGTGPLEAECRRMAADAKLSEVVLFHGFEPAIHERMASLDLLVMPSLHEGLPYVLLEAMSLRVPIVASRVGGLREVLDDGSGMLVPPGDPYALATAIERLYGDRELRARFAARAHDTVRQRFAARDMVRAYSDLYRQLLGRAS
jgi:glycosyltransferase involved in cell wall biosynthesis